MPSKEAVLTQNAPPPAPFFSQAIKSNGMVYVSGNVGLDPKTKKLVEGGVADRTVCDRNPASFDLYKTSPRETLLLIYRVATSPE